MSSIQSLSSALSGLVAARRKLETHGHNIANASTEGYTRQRAIQAPVGAGVVSRVFASSPSDPGGVMSMGVERLSDVLLQSRMATAIEGQGATQATEKYMMRIEDAFAEPSESAISGQLTRYWGAWASLAISPDSTAARQQVLAEGEQLAYSLRRADTEMSDTLTYAGAELEATASEINNLSEQIADLNGAIVSAGRNTTSQADLWDQRDRHVSRLAQLTGATSRVREDGQAAVFVGGRVLVDNKTVLKVQATSTELQWAMDGAKVDASGYVGSLHTLVSTTIPALRASLDAVAASLVSQTNAIHTAAADPSGATGRLFYDPAGVTAATIAISTDPTNGVAGNPQRVAAASVAGAVFDGSAAHALALLGDAPTGPDAAYMGFLSSLGVATSSARSRAASSELVLAAASNDYNATAQVNLDDELAEMTAAQRAYQASARVVTAIDEMLDDLIRRFGRVGA